MKILAIRGENLASLAGPFEVRLDEGALGGAGVFAVVGATGSGKSTLLDAMCVALFQDTPRLQGKGGAGIGRADLAPDDRLSAHDLRGLISRGARGGFAEVDWRAEDGTRYRARWQVQRRPRSKRGKWGDPVFSLVHLDRNEQLFLGDKVKAFREWMQPRVGLSFEQFQKTVLLPQGSFAAFLRGDERSRAEILEVMTRTERYGQISMRAYQSAAEARRKKDLVYAQIQRMGGLSADEREALTVQQQSAEMALNDAVGEREACQASLRGWETRRSLLEGVHAAERDRDLTMRALEEGSERWARLDQYVALTPLFQRFAALDAALAARDQGATVLARAWIAQREAEGTLTRVFEAFDSAQARVGEAEAARAAAEPELDQAAEVDRDIAAAHARLDSTRHQRAAAEAAERAQRDALAAAHAQVVALEAQHERLTQMLENPALVGLLRGWGRLRPALERRALLDRRLRDLRQMRGQAEERLGVLVRTRDLAETDLQAALGEIQALTAREEIDARALGAFDEPSSSEALARLRQRERVKAETLSVAREREARERALQQHLVALAAMEREEVADQAAAPALRRAVVETEVRLDEVARSIAALSYEQARGQLRDGEPCPLCGAIHHPFAVDHPDWALIAARRDDLREHLRRFSEEIAQAEARAALRQRARKGEQEAISELERALAEGAGVVEPSSAIELALARTRDEIVVLETHLQAYVRARRALDAAREVRQLAERRGHDARAMRDTRAAEAETAARTSAELRQREQEQTLELDALAAELVPLLADAGAESWMDDPSDGIIKGEKRVLEANRLQKERENRAHDLRNAQLAVATHEGALEPLIRAVHAAVSEVEAAQTGLLTLETARRALLGGRSVAVVREALGRALRLAQDERGRAAGIHTRAVAAESAAQQQRAADHARWTELEQLVVNEQQTLSPLLHAEALSEEAARALWAEDGPWRADAAAKRDALQTELARLEARLEERQCSLDAHDQGASDVMIDVADAQEALRRATAAAKQAEGDLRQLAARLLEDERQRAQRSALEAELSGAAQTAAEWARLADVIGSADGNRFRVFAQGLTLEHLLSYANSHLARLKPRYSLERIPGANLLFQVVDHEQGMDVRPVESLSGGESFLVSLALALGMASMTSSHLQLETLFIDEGFGTLDPDALAMVMSALHTLQSQGRQVGVITHVEGMAEQLAARVEVKSLGGGRSSLHVVGRSVSLRAEASAH